MYKLLKSSKSRKSSRAGKVGKAVVPDVPSATPELLRLPGVDPRAALEMAASIVSKVTAQRAKAKAEPNIGLYADDEEGQVKEFIPSGFRNIDKMLGGGWPIGRISEVFGPERSGKSALADMAIASVCKMGGFAVVEEFEHTRMQSRLARMGADLRRVVMHEPKHAMDAWKNIWAVYKQIKAEQAKHPGKPTPPFLILWDSLGSCAADQAELDSLADGETPRPGKFAAVMASNLHGLYSAIREVRAHFMCINQIRASMKAGAKWGPQQVETTGGYAVKFAYTVRVECKSWMYPFKVQPKIGYGCQVKTEKNKIVFPGEVTGWILDKELGPSPALTVFYALKQVRVIKPSAMAGKLTCPILKTFTRDGWVQAFENAEFADKAWALMLERNASPLRESSGGAEEEE